MDLTRNRAIKWTKIIIGGLIVAFLIHSCNGLVNKFKGYFSPSKPQIDTVVVHTTDTVWAKDTVYSFKKIRIPVPKIVYLDSTNTSSCSNVTTYEDSLVDKNISIYYKDYILQGDLIGKDLSYKLKVPLTIIDSKTITITKKDSIPFIPKYQVGIGVTGGFTETAPTIYITNKRQEIGLGYNLQAKSPLEGVRLTYKFRLWKSRK